MASELIFITGATGFIGSTTTDEALKSGYRLRIAIRNESQIEKLSAVFSKYAGQFEFVIVPSITDEAAFAGKLDGVDYVLHLASPLANSPDKQKIFPAAVQGTLAVLKEAAKVKSVKRVVITSSEAAFTPLTGLPQGAVLKGNNLLQSQRTSQLANYHVEDYDWDVTVDENADFTQATPEATAFKVYHASKILANQASWRFMEEEKPHFSLITIHPSFVYGHNIMQTSAAQVASGTNGLLWNFIMNGAGPAASLSCVHVRDVAEAHVKALSPSITASTSYLLIIKPALKDIVDVLEREYPSLPFKLTRETKVAVSLADAGKATRELGIKFRGIQEIVREIVDQQLGFAKAG